MSEEDEEILELLEPDKFLSRCDEAQLRMNDMVKDAVNKAKREGYLEALGDVESLVKAYQDQGRLEVLFVALKELKQSIVLQSRAGKEEGK